MRIEESRDGLSRKHLWRPAGHDGAVAAMWLSEGAAAGPRERMFPNGTVRLCVSFGEPFRRIEGTRRSRLPAVWLTVLDAGPRVIELPARHHALVVQLRPQAAHALLGVPMCELSGRTLGLEDLIGRPARELAKCCADADSARDRFRAASGWLAARLADPMTGDERVDRVARAIEQSGGRVAIASLRERAGLSRARLASGFRERIGVGPKRYARLVRLRRALRLLQGSGSLSEVALEAGYADQPHLNAEVRELCGVTPGALVGACAAHGQTILESA